MRYARLPLIAAGLCLSAAAAQTQAPQPACGPQALAQAKALLAFHSGGDERIEIAAHTLRQLPPLANPANQQQKLPVLEVIGHIYKADYRLRLIYAPAQGCLLVGQEVLGLSSY